MTVDRPELHRLAAAARQAEAAAAQARRDVATAQTRSEAIAAQLGLRAAEAAAAAPRAQLTQALAGLFDQLDPAVPLALLPVRLETRYQGPPGRRDLLIRIYPDDVHSDTHEPGLTDAEAAFGRHFWTEVWRAGRDDRAQAESAWRQLVQRFGTGRATWVADQLRPTNPDDRPVLAIPATEDLPVPPDFPSVPSRPGPWSRAALAGCLPDRFVAAGFRGGERVFGRWGAVIDMALPIGPDPDESQAAGEDPFEQDWYRWKTDFGAAVDAGLGIRIPAADLGASEELDLLLVYGIRGSTAPGDAAAELTALLRGHRHTWGLDLVPQGTATNNTPDTRSGYRRADPDPAQTFEALDAARPAAGTDAADLARALGVDPALFATLQHRDALDQRDARAMNTVAWSAWWAYWCRRLLGDVFGGSDERERLLPGWRRHFLDHVRARGPLPAIRIGDQPYGVLPVSSLDRWDLDGRGPSLVAVDRAGLSVGWEPDPSGVPAAWGLPVPLPSPADVRATAVGRSRETGRPWLVVLRPLELRIGRALDPRGVAHGGWTDPVPLPDPATLDGSVAIAASGSHVAVFQLLPGLRVTGARMRVARDLDDAGVPGGWSDPVDIGLRLPAAARALGMGWRRRDVVVVLAVADRGGKERVAVLIGRGFDVRGAATGGWTGLIDVPDLSPGAVTATVVPGEDRFALFVADADAVYVRDATVSEQRRPIERPLVRPLAPALLTVTWEPLSAFAAPSGPPIALAAGDVGRSGATGLTSEVGLVNLLARLRDAWSVPAEDGTVPTLGRPGVTDPDKVFLDLLTTGATTTGVAVRSLLGPALVSNLWRLMGVPVDAGSLGRYLTALGDDAEDLPLRLGLPPTAWLQRAAYADETTDLAVPLVQEPALSESEPVTPPYVEWLAAAGRDPEDIHQRRYLADLRIDEQREPLLVKVLRHALQNGYIDAALRQPVSAADERLRDGYLGRLVTTQPDGGPGPDIGAIDPELVDLTDFVRDVSPSPAGALTRWTYLRRRHATTGEDLGERLRGTGIDAELDELRAAVEHLAGRPSAALDRLLTEALDLATHRLDAWLTSLPARRLAEWRAGGATGVHLGAWGFVEHLRPSTRPQSTGFVHAPSIGHAATAAVLRSAWLSHGGQDAFAVDLTSARVRRATEVLDGIRRRQPLGALLGYQLERGLHEGHPGQDLDRYIAPLRARFPLVAGQLTPTAPGEPAEGVAARNVVDGLALVRAGFAAAALPGVSAAEAASIDAEIARLRDALDAVADLGIAESVHQAVHGRHGGTGAVLDALSKGTQAPPEIEVVQTPRTGVAVQHRILVLLPAVKAPGDDRGARAAAEPALDGWVAALLGDPARVRWRVREQGEQGTVSERTRTLADLRLSALDVVSLDERSDLELLLELDAARSRPAGATVTGIVLERDTAWPPGMLSLEEFGVAARAVRELLDAATPADGHHLAGSGSAGLVDAEELRGRADAATAALAAAHAALRDCFALDDDALAVVRLAVAAPDTVLTDNLLDLAPHLDLPKLSAVAGGPVGGLDAVRDALLALWHFGVAGAMPRSADGDDDTARAVLVRQAQAVHLETARRRTAASGAADPLTEVFGRGFRFLPRFTVADPGTLAQAFAGRRVAADAGPAETLAWLGRVARVRPATARLEHAFMLTEAPHRRRARRPDIDRGPSPRALRPAGRVGPAGRARRRRVDRGDPRPDRDHRHHAALRRPGHGPGQRDPARRPPGAGRAVEPRHPGGCPARDDPGRPAPRRRPRRRARLRGALPARRDPRHQRRRPGPGRHRGYPVPLTFRRHHAFHHQLEPARAAHPQRRTAGRAGAATRPAVAAGPAVAVR
ncbi:hypothetical protein ACGFZQ_12955 [Streptomyces sp. NPDC048254]|uniref:hypothetical protein n=1 Tax=Streptomyces sp. NPDC048254 TaxID=3365525 RepID=UPI003713C1D9